MKLQIDIRETHLLNLATFYQEKDPSFQFEEIALDIGDIRIHHQSYCLLLERKTLSDLAASIRDGRWHEQKKRLQGISQQQPHTKICYIIEGILPTEPQAINRLPYKTVLSGLIHTLFRDGIPIYKTSNLRETFSLIKGLANKMEHTPQKLGFTETSQKGPVTYETNLIKIKKKENLTPPRCYELMLAQIPGISYKTAKRIADTYPTLSLLLQKFHSESESTRPFCLSSIPKIGKKTSQTIYQFLQL